MKLLEAMWSDFYGVASGFFGDADYLRLALSIGFLLLVWLVRGPLAAMIGYVPSRLAQRTGLVTPEQAKALLSGSLRVAVMGAAVLVAMAYSGFEGLQLEIARNLGLSLLAVAFFRFVIAALPLFRAAWQSLEITFGSDLVDWLMKGLRVATFLVAAATILQLWGIQVAPIIAGAGLFGIAVALGAQEFFKNLIGGMLILAGRRFYKGEWIKVPGVVEGTVESIGFHSTVVRLFDKAPVTLPNTMLSDAAVVNYSRRPHRRISWTIGLVYQTTVPQLAEIRDRIEALINESGDYVDPPSAPVLVRVDKFNESSIDLIVYCFTKTSDWNEWLKIKEGLAFSILQIVEEAGSSMAYPSQTLYLQQNADINLGEQGPSA